METPENILARLQAAFPSAKIELLPNGCPSQPPSLLLDPAFACEIATFLKNDAALRLDHATNVTGVDWPKEGYIEAVYHLFSMEKKHGPLIIRLRTANRDTAVVLPSLTPVWRSADLQEREIFDLFGIKFEGHPDLRRILMWDGFKDHPMRKDYVAPDDFEYEPTAHDDVLERAQQHFSKNA